MHLLYCDESNLESRPGDFFVYGGLAFPAETTLALSREIDNLRADAQVPQSFQLKFNPGPENVTHQQFVALKQSILEAAVRAGVKLKTSFILHDVATSPNEARRNEINRICFHFNGQLHRDDSQGLVLIDRFDDQQIDDHLRQKFSIGLTGMPYGNPLRLDRIVGFHYSAIGQSHFPSVVDIILGSVRFCINVHTRGQEQFQETARTILGLIAPFYRTNQNGGIAETELFFSPKVVRAAVYRERYESLKNFLSQAGINAVQPITNQRMY